MVPPWSKPGTQQTIPKKINQLNGCKRFKSSDPHQTIEEFIKKRLRGPQFR